MSEKRRDNRNRILREGEYQRKDGRYRFRYIDAVSYTHLDVYKRQYQRERYAAVRFRGGTTPGRTGELTPK